jgi:hypothetical protein
MPPRSRPSSAGGVPRHAASGGAPGSARQAGQASLELGLRYEACARTTAANTYAPYGTALTRSPRSLRSAAAAETRPAAEPPPWVRTTGGVPLPGELGSSSQLSVQGQSPR